MLQNKNEIIPIEVKSGNITKNNSLTKYNKKYNCKKSIRFSLNNLKQDGKILNIPLYLIDSINKFI